MIEFDGKNLLVTTPYSQSKEIKEDLGGQWDKKLNVWKLPPISLNVLQLVAWYGSEILEGAPDEIRELAESPWGFLGFSDEERAIAQRHPSWDTLYPFQQEGVEYLYCNPHGAALCALSWGLGKGAVSIVAADLLNAERVLVLAPLTLATAWVGEFERWSAHARDIKRAHAGDREPGDGVTIANHEVIQEIVLRDEDGVVFQPDWATNARRVKEWQKEGPDTVDPRTQKEKPVRQRIVRVRRDYLDVDWDLIVIDESVLLKNRKAIKTNVLTQLRKGRDPFIFELSGSPTTKYRDDLFRQMQILAPRAFKSYWRFAEFFCVVDRDGWGWTIEGDRPDRDPQNYLRDFIWVMSQDQALLDLPEYIDKHVPLEALPNQRKALDQMFKDWVVELEEDPDALVADNWLARSTRLQQITSNMGTLPKPSGGFFKRESAKEDLLFKFIEQGDIEYPLLVWTWYVETTHALMDRFAKKAKHLKSASVIGEDSRQWKDDTIADFKNGELDVLVMQMNIGKFGHTFTGTKTVFYHDRTFDSDAWVQSLHRVRRIGLKHRPVLIIPSVLESADQLINANLEGKLESIARMTNADLMRLLRSLYADNS